MLLETLEQSDQSHTLNSRLGNVIGYMSEWCSSDTAHSIASLWTGIEFTQVGSVTIHLPWLRTYRSEVKRCIGPWFPWSNFCLRQRRRQRRQLSGECVGNLVISRVCRPLEASFYNERSLWQLWLQMGQKARDFSCLPKALLGKTILSHAHTSVLNSSLIMRFQA